MKRVYQRISQIFNYLTFVIIKQLSKLGGDGKGSYLKEIFLSAKFWQRAKMLKGDEQLQLFDIFNISIRNWVAFVI